MTDESIEAIADVMFANTGREAMETAKGIIAALEERGFRIIRFTRRDAPPFVFDDLDSDPPSSAT